MEILKGTIEKLPYTVTENILDDKQMLSETLKEIKEKLSLLEKSDYIVEQGSIEGWEYKVWKSGTVDMWYSLIETPKAHSDSLSMKNWTFSQIPYPSIFQFESRIEYASLYGNDTNAGWLGIDNSEKDLNQTAVYKLYRNLSSTDPDELQINFYVHGKIKL